MRGKLIIHMAASNPRNYSHLALPEGTIVYEYTDCTYGCIAPGGIAVTLEEGKTPFFELPKNVILWDNDKTSANNR